MTDEKTFKPVNANEKSNNGRVIKQAHHPSGNSKDEGSFDGLFGIKSACAIIIVIIACVIPIVLLFIGLGTSPFLYFILGLVAAVFVFSYAIIVEACSKYLKS